MKNVILCGDVREKLREIPDGYVNCVVTSPPYWGLRDYGTASWEGGDPECTHAVARSSATSTLGIGKGQASWEAAQRREAAVVVPYREACGKCGARRIDNQLGLEATPDEYVSNLVAVFREVRRVLRDDGTVWLNLGDSYAGSGKGPSNSLQPSAAQIGARLTGQFASGQAPTQWLSIPSGLKAKDLVGIPWRVAFALQADGWWLRSDIIWSKPNPMPESVTDRPTKSHEYVFLLSKSATYYYDAEAIKEAAIHEGRVVKASGSNARNALVGDGVNDRRVAAGFTSHDTVVSGRNRRTVWEIATEPYPDAHFATYPTELVKPCILAGCPEGGIVLDPFFGSGTTGLVAARAGRDWIGIELNPTYVEMAERRLAAVKDRLL